MESTAESRQAPRKIPDVRALGRLRWVLGAIAVPFCVVVLGVGIQAAAFERPPRDALVASDALRELFRFRVMRATEMVGRHPVRSTCVQGWFRPLHSRRPAPGELVLLSSGVKLYDFGNGIRRIGRRGAVSRFDLARFLLAGCPRFMAERVGSQLVRSRWVDTDASRADGVATLELSFGDRTKPIGLYVDRRTYRPVALRLAGAPKQGWSDLIAGGGRAAVLRVRQAFHLLAKSRNNA